MLVTVGVYWRALTPNTLITITSSKYLISYPINMKVSNQVFNTSNSNVLGSLVLVRARDRYQHATIRNKRAQETAIQT